MRNLITLLILLISFTVSAQTYEGTAKVAMISGDYASIVFGSRGHAPSIFTIKISELDDTKSKLVEGKRYYFVLKRVKFKGTRKTAEVYFHEKDRRQMTIELNAAKEKITDKIISL